MASGNIRSFIKNNLNRQYVYWGVLVTGVILLGLSFWYAYRIHTIRLEQAAYKDFVEIVEGYRKATQQAATGSDHQLADIEQAFETAVHRHKGTALEPYFLAYQAQLQADKGNIDQAIELLGQSLKQIDRSSSLFFVYQLKQARLIFQTNDTQHIGQAINMLEQGLENKHNPLQDAYRYYIAQGLSQLGRKEHAQRMVEELNKSASAVWSERAQRLLA